MNRNDITVLMFLIAIGTLLITMLVLYLITVTQR
jgi:hypothetical protein